VTSTHQEVWKGRFKDKWANLHEFMQLHPTVLVERKYNGTRVFFISDSEGKQVLATKHNGVYSKADYPELFRDLQHVPPRTILDGELVKGSAVPPGEPHPFTLPETFLHIFDYLNMGGSDSVMYRPLKNRKLLLNALSLGPHAKLVESPVCNTEQQVREYFDLAIGDGFEGLVVKDPEAPYRVGRSWLKLRDTETVDAFVTKLDPPDDQGTVWTYTVGLYRKGTALVDWTGRVSSAHSDIDRSKIRVDTVLEIRFNTFEGKIVFPGTIVSIRDDKLPTECNTEQL